MYTLRNLLKHGEGVLAEAGISDATTDAWLLFEHVFDMTRSRFLLKWDDPADDNKAEEYLALVFKRCGHIPLQYITGVQEFMGLLFEVNENVLIPRQDTEILVEKIMDWINNKTIGRVSVLDMCTGSGCIAVSLAVLLKEARVTGADISEKALETAKRNALLNHAECDFIRSDMFSDVSGRYDVIVSNPPYIRTADIEELMDEVKIHEPSGALDGGTDGLKFYRILVEKSHLFLREGGLLALEIGHDQAQDISLLLEENGYDEIEIVKDLPGLDRVVLATKHERKKNYV